MPDHNGLPAPVRITKETVVPDFTVHQFGTDTSGRPILMTQFMHDWWQGVVAELGFEPTIVQGAFMSRIGGGAAASAGYHDLGGCMDVRTRDLTGDQLDRLVRGSRSRGGAAWRRDETAAHGGMDSHCHITLGADQPLSPGARASWQSYLDGRNGLANNAPDYEWRPEPLVTTPPQEDDMAQYADQLDRIQKAAEAAEAAAEKAARLLERQRERQRNQASRIVERLDRLKDTGATGVQVAELRAAITEMLVDDKDE